jgi:uncharacterized protein with GYD domain
MPMYLFRASYTPEGAKGLMKEGGTKRRDAVRQMTEKAGGKLHAFYYAFGDADLYIISEYPDAATCASVALAVNSSGAATVQTVVLLTPEEVDAAVKKSTTYRAPGS